MVLASVLVGLLLLITCKRLHGKLLKGRNSQLSEASNTVFLNSSSIAQETETLSLSISSLFLLLLVFGVSMAMLHYLWHNLVVVVKVDSGLTRLESKEGALPSHVTLRSGGNRRGHLGDRLLPIEVE